MPGQMDVGKLYQAEMEALNMMEHRHTQTHTHTPGTYTTHTHTHPHMVCVGEWMGGWEASELASEYWRGCCAAISM